MARGEGILIGFPQGNELPAAVMERSVRQTEEVADRYQQQDRAYGLQQGQEKRADERQTWERAMQPFKIQEATDLHIDRQRKLDEADRKVKREGAAQAAWGELAARFGSDTPPTAEEILVAQGNMGVASQNWGAATSAMHTLAEIKRGDDKGKAVGELIENVVPMLSQLHTPDGLSNMSKKLGEFTGRAQGTTTYQKLFETMLKSYENVYPPQAAEAMQEYRLAVSAGKDPSLSWNNALASRPEAARFFGVKGNLPKDIQDAIEESNTGKRQAGIRKQVELDKRETQLQVAAAKAKSTRELAEYREGARKDLETVRAKLRQHGTANDAKGMKAAATVANQALGRAQAESKALIKQLDAGKGPSGEALTDDERQFILDKIDTQHQITTHLQDSLNAIADATARAATPGAEAPTTTPKATPAPGAGADAQLDKVAKPLRAALERAQKTQGKAFNRDAELRKAINALVQAGTMTKEQGIALYRREAAGQ